jgi:hypothetical protein
MPITMLLFSTLHFNSNIIGRPRRRWEDNIKMNIGTQGVMIWTQLMWFRTRSNDEFL